MLQRAVFLALLFNIRADTCFCQLHKAAIDQWREKGGFKDSKEKSEQMPHTMVNTILPCCR